ncbi:hypothetical protein MAR_018625 [Mya arenaria]|uniref:Uncharacterized protein n=1 Tax=Mya arenaria TaxID=6604 RepID=A0ABY7EID8_MYAAR|nr:hypothetical protein MAR_018625 [Mya arenaria]
MAGTCWLALKLAPAQKVVGAGTNPHA